MDGVCLSRTGSRVARRAARRRRWVRRGGVAPLAVATVIVLGAGAWSATSPHTVAVNPGEVAVCNRRFVKIDARTVRCPASMPPASPAPPPTPPVSTPVVPVPSPAASTCSALEPPLTGRQSTLYTTIPQNRTLDARTAVWDSTQAGDYAVSVFGAENGSCWLGGIIRGDWPFTDPWTSWHYRAGLRWSQPDMTVDRVVIANYGDALKPKDDGGGQATNWTVRHTLVINAHDDCLENDYVHSGLIEDTLFESCYVGISARPDRTGYGGLSETVTIRNTLLRLKPMTSVYKGSSPGTGGFFKWTTDQSPALDISDSVFRADQLPNHQDLGLPDVPIACRSNVVLWSGDGPFPGRASWLEHCPDTTIIEGKAAPAIWDAAVRQWLSTP